MRATRKIIGVLLALMLVFGMSSSVFAATVSVSETDTHTYDVYQIFTGTVNDSNELSDVKWGKNGTGNQGDAVPTATLQSLKNVNNSNKTDMEKIAVILGTVSFEGEKYGSINKDQSITVEPGYYMYVDRGPAINGDEFSFYVVEVTNADLTLTPKKDKVESFKKVQDDTVNGVPNETGWQDSADYDIGDLVPFQLTGTVSADYDQYFAVKAGEKTPAYYYAFHDTLSDGLTFNESSVVVKVGQTTLEKDVDYRIVKGAADGCTFEVVFENLKNVDAVTAGATITVDYNATLDNDAVIGTAGNPNTMKLEYSNNPHAEGTAFTPEDKVTVFTYKAIVNKVDAADNSPLKGAGFTLYKDDQPIGEEVAGENLTTFEWTGLDAGTYKLVETTVPAGYRTMGDIVFTIEATHEAEAADPQLTSLSAGEDFTVDLTAGTLTTTVENVYGTELPSTGGMGTTILYIIGGMLILGAAGALVYRRRTAA